MQGEYRKIKNLFLRQSYLDAWEDYQRSVRKVSFPHWDYVVLTSSNDFQADAFRTQIGYRKEKNLLPKNTKFIVLPDPAGERIGSGGATLQVLRVLSEQEELRGDFHNLRVLVIHSGGDSKRIPQYSICGKLFSPVPRELPDGRGSSLFDEFLIGMAGVPSRFKEGMLVLSGDVLLLFNPLQIDAQYSGATAISMKVSAEVGESHGVFLNDGNNYVKNFLHKQKRKKLVDIGAVNAQGNVDLDTGAVLCGAELCGKLFSLISRNGEVSEEKYSKFVNNKARISFYGDFLYPLASDSTLEQYYKEKPEGTYCNELKECRKEIWNTLSSYRMKLVCVSPAEFIHFGTTKELLKLVTEDINDYEFLDWKSSVFTNRKQGNGTFHNALIEESVQVKGNCYIENSWIRGNTIIQRGAIISQLRVSNLFVPANTVLHGVRLHRTADDMGQNYVVRIYGVGDNPKQTMENNATLLSNSMEEIMKKNNLEISDIWDTEEHTLWNAKLYSSYSTEQEAAEKAMLIYRMSEGTASKNKVIEWKLRQRYSLWDTFLRSETSVLVERTEELQNRILLENFLTQLKNGVHYITALKVFGELEINEKQYDMLKDMLVSLSFSEKIRALYAVSRSMKYQSVLFNGKSYDQVESECFKLIQQEIFRASFAKRIRKYKIVEDDVHISLPVRVNWGGGWTDTPPYCNEKGGVVLNAAIKLKGKEPIEVEIRRIPELHIEFASLDFEAFETVKTVTEIQDCHNPYDFFALHKSALIACGIIPISGDADLKNILEGLGGGIYLSTKVIGVPKGSGLGTSSILAAACMKAIGKFMGEKWSDADIYELVLNLEQIMSTGGGWQDQVGGLIPGIKYITSKSGLNQKLKVQNLNLEKNTIRELQDRFVLIYTGQRRLARNLLREVVGNYIGGRKESLEALEQMKFLTVLMRYALEQGDIDQLAQLLNQHWELSKQLDSGSTNTCIEQIFGSCEDLIDGRFVAGAGGGGFLQVILKRNVTKNMLQERLDKIFQDSGVDVWDCEFV